MERRKGQLINLNCHFWLFTVTGAERRQEYIAEIKTNKGSNDKGL